MTKIPLRWCRWIKQINIILILGSLEMPPKKVSGLINHCQCSPFTMTEVLFQQAKCREEVWRIYQRKQENHFPIHTKHITSCCSNGRGMSLLTQQFPNGWFTSPLDLLACWAMAPCFIIYYFGGRISLATLVLQFSPPENKMEWTYYNYRR